MSLLLEISHFNSCEVIPYDNFDLCLHDVLVMLSYSSCYLHKRILCLSFKSLLHLELVFEYHVRKGSLFLFICLWVSSFPAPSTEETILSALRIDSALGKG